MRVHEIVCLYFLLRKRKGGLELNIEKRTEALSVVRANEKVPGVLSGKNFNPISIQIAEKDLHDLFKEFGCTHTFKVKFGKETHTVYIKNVQRDPMNHKRFLNVKLQRVKSGDSIKTDLPIHVIGKELIDKPHIIIQIISDTISVEYPIDKDLSRIDVDVSKLKVGDNIHLRDLKLPDFLILHDDLNKILITVTEATLVKHQEAEAEKQLEDKGSTDHVKQEE